jgi:hypothetical protein
MAWALRDIIDEFLNLYSDSDVVNNKLTDLEWSIVRVIKDFLEKLYMSTKACESRELTLDLSLPCTDYILSLPCTDYILSLFKKHKDIYKDDPTFATMFNSG